MKAELTVYHDSQHGHQYYYLNQDGLLIASASCQIDGGDWFVFRSSEYIADRCQIARYLRAVDMTGAAGCHAAAHAIALDYLAAIYGADHEVEIMFRGEMLHAEEFAL